MAAPQGPRQGPGASPAASRRDPGPQPPAGPGLRRGAPGRAVGPGESCRETQVREGSEGQKQAGGNQGSPRWRRPPGGRGGEGGLVAAGGFVGRVVLGRLFCGARFSFSFFPCKVSVGQDVGRGA